jgi:hypothetical protein
MVDACGSEALNEFLIIQSGAGFNTAAIQLNYDGNNNIFSAQNNDVRMNVNNFPSDTTPCGISMGNAGHFTGCSNVIAVGNNFEIPPDNIVVFQTSSGSTNATYNFSALCGAGQCIYVVASSCTRTAGAFTNPGSGLRTTTFQIAGGCTQTFTYNRASLVGTDGAYYLPITNTYGNVGCAVPPGSTAPPAPSVDQPANITVCSSDAVNVTFTPSGGTYNWTNNNTNIGLDGNGTGDISFNAALVNTTQAATITVTPIGDCPGVPKIFTITVNPLPTINPPSNIVACATGNVNVSFSGGPPGTTYSWTNDNPNTGLGASGNNTLSFTAADVTDPEISNVTIIPTLGSCEGPPVSFTITINPRPTLDDPPNITVCSLEPVEVNFTGSGNPTFNWTNTNSAIGLGASGNGNIDFNSNPVTNPTTGTITITPTALGCTGPTQNFTITVVPVPTVNQPGNITACGGSSINIPFTGNASAFSWTNDNPNIGLSGSGNGNILFTAVQTANQEIATLTVIPSNAGCEGIPRTFLITINPRPTVDDPDEVETCADTEVNILFTGEGNPSFTWTNSNANIGLPTNGNGDINFTTANVTNPTTATINVTPVANGCTGTAQIFTITVNPLPNVNQPANVTACGGNPVVVNFSGLPAGTLFSWTNNNPNIGLPDNGTGNITFPTNPVTLQEIGQITVTPQNGLCAGNPKVFTITVNPIPTITNPGDQNACPGDDVSVNFQADGAVTWTNSNTQIGLQATGTGDISFTAPTVAALTSGTITATATANGCASPTSSFIITVSPPPILMPTADLSYCAGSPHTINFSGNPPGATIHWVSTNPATGIPPAGNGNIVFSTNTTTTQTTQIIASPQFGTCEGAADTFILTIKPQPILQPTADIETCAQDTISLNFTASANNTDVNWINNNPSIGLPPSGFNSFSHPVTTTQNKDTATIIAIPSAQGCPGNPDTFLVVVKAKPSVDNPGTQNICGGDSLTISLPGSNGSTPIWVNDNPSIGLPTNGQGSISFQASLVTSPLSAQITAASSINGCNSDTINFTINVVTTPTFNNPGVQKFCAGLPATINFNAGNTTLQWTNNNPSIGLPTNGSGNITFIPVASGIPDTAIIFVTPSLGNCTGTPEPFLLISNPRPSVYLSGDSATCLGNSVTLTAHGGDTYAWSTGETTATPNIQPTSTQTYTVTATNAAGCTNTASTVLIVYPVKDTLILANTCNPSDTGTVSTTLTTVFGCDSVVTRKSILLPTSAITIQQFSCNPNQLGTFTQQFTNTFGCDSTVTTQVLFNPGLADTTTLQKQTCNPNLAGTSQALLIGADGCDSLIITITSLLPNSSTTLTTSTCKPTEAGIFTEILVNFAGCDSTITTTVSYDPNLIDTTQINFFTCVPTQIGVFTTTLINSSGCDSVIIANFLFDPAGTDTTHVSKSSCDPTQAGITLTQLTNANGCDSIVVTTTTLAPSYNISTTNTTCNPAEAGIFVTPFTTTLGCDSIRTHTILFDPASIDTTFLQTADCDPNKVGVSVDRRVGINGCDSIVITTTTLLPPNITYVFEATCNPNGTGTVIDTYNINGCDSVIIRNIAFDPSLLDTTLVELNTCDSDQAGVVTQILTNVVGCDSTIITTTIYNPTLCAPEISIVATPPNCPGQSTASVLMVATTGVPPLQFQWTDGNGNVGTGSINSLNTPVVVAGLSAGTFQVTVTASAGPPTIQSINIAAPPPFYAQIASLTSNNGFDIPCADQQIGAVSAISNGGTPPLSFSWSTGATGNNLASLPASTYTVTILDANNCTATAEITLSQPPPLALKATSDSTKCGDTTTTLRIEPLGGIAPYFNVVNGQTIFTSHVVVGTGIHRIEITDANYCTLITFIPVEIPPIPTISLPEDTLVNIGTTLQIIATTNMNAWESIVWNPLPDPDCPTCLQQVWSPQATETYSVTLTDTFGCTATSDISVVVTEKADVFVPNIINIKDAYDNGLFRIGTGPSVKSLEFVRIYDRWGNLVYQLDSPTEPFAWPGWNGKFNNQLVPTGVYVYALQLRLLNDELIIKTGDLTIISR